MHSAKFDGIPIFVGSCSRYTHCLNQQPPKQPPNDFGLSALERPIPSKLFILLVPGGGVEPPRPQGSADFESAASASSAIPARGGCSASIAQCLCWMPQSLPRAKARSKDSARRITPPDWWRLRAILIDVLSVRQLRIFRGIRRCLPWDLIECGPCFPHHANRFLARFPCDNEVNRDDSSLLCSRS